jgi:RNA ligase (TIGR02306 family)
LNPKDLTSGLSDERNILQNQEETEKQIKMETETNTRKLASLQVVREIRPIEGADMIELAIINDWQAVVAKTDNVKKGDMVVYCEIDSFLPIIPEFEFLRKSSYKKLVDGQEGFRLKTIRLRGELSQGLVIPIDKARQVALGMGNEFPDTEGTDVTTNLGIIKYEPPVPAHLSGMARGNFPSFIAKTDELRIQGLTRKWDEYRKKEYYVAEKLEGSSTTVYLWNGVFGVCSRNLDLQETDDNTYWKVVRDLHLEERMRSLGLEVATQGELIGEGVQGNIYGIKGHELRVFNVFDPKTHRKLPLVEMLELVHNINMDGGPELKHVPILEISYKLPETIGELLLFAEGKSQLNPKVEREGIVLRTLDCEVSFKAISNKYLLGDKN